MRCSEGYQDSTKDKSTTSHSIRYSEGYQDSTKDESIILHSMRSSEGYQDSTKDKSITLYSLRYSECYQDSTKGKSSTHKASMVRATKTIEYGYTIPISMPSYQMEISHEHYGIEQIWIRN